MFNTCLLSTSLEHVVLSKDPSVLTLIFVPGSTPKGHSFFEPF